MKKFIILLFIFCLSQLQALYFEPDTPIFEKPDIKSNVIAWIIDPVELETVGEPVVFFDIQHPLARYVKFHQINLKNGPTAYISDFYRGGINTDNKTQLILGSYQPTWRYVLFSAVLGALAVVVYTYVRGRRDKTIMPDSFAEGCCFVAAIIFLRQLLLLMLLINGDNVCCAPADEPGYFKVAADLLRGKMDGPWSYPIGFGVLFYIPAILLTGAEKVTDFLVGFSYFSGLVLSPATLGMSYIVLRKVGIKSINSLFAVLLLTLLPFFFNYIPNWSNQTFTSLIIPLPMSYGLCYYNSLLNAGFSAMSDISSNLMLVLTMMVPLLLKPRLRNIAITAALFSLCCMIRLNNILFAPALGYLLFYHYRSLLVNRNFMIKAILTGAITFLIVYSPQFYFNHRQFGSVMTFGYILHASSSGNPAAGFTFATFLKFFNLKFLADSNFLPWTLGICGLLLLRNRFLRNFFALWALPNIIFFFGYSHTFCDAFRFILSSYFPLLAAFAACEIWTDGKSKERAMAGGVIAATALGSVPFMIHRPSINAMFLKTELLQKAAVVLLPVAAVILCCLFWRRQQKTTAIFLGVFTVLWSVGTAYILSTLLALILLRAVYDAASEIIATTSGGKYCPRYRLSAPESAPNDPASPSGA